MSGSRTDAFFLCNCGKRMCTRLFQAAIHAEIGMPFSEPNGRLLCTEEEKKNNALLFTRKRSAENLVRYRHRSVQ